MWGERGDEGAEEWDWEGKGGDVVLSDFGIGQEVLDAFGEDLSHNGWMD